MNTPKKRPWAMLAIALCLCLAGAFGAGAISTRSFVLDSEKRLSEGTLDGTAVYSNGTVVPGVQTDRIALPGVPLARCMLATADGRTYVGTGDEGKIYVLTGSDLSVHAETGELLVTDLVEGPGGVVYAATLPNGKVFSVTPEGEAKLFSQLEDAEHVWALAYVAKSRTLYAATGPEGKLFAIDAKGKASVYLDTEDEHVMALALDTDGTLYAGTSDRALLLRLRGPGKVEVVHDFEGNEVTAIDVAGGRIAVAANLFPKASSSKPKKRNGKDTDSKSSSTSVTIKSPASTTRPKLGKGQLWRIEAGGRALPLFDSDKGHITAVQWGPDDTIYVGIGKDGLIYRVGADGHHALWVDVDERQVLALDLAGKQPRFVTGDAAAVYRVREGKAQEALWTSKVLDASFHARWGQLGWRSGGKVAFQTRSGQTEQPDDSWSEWSSVMRSAGPIRSPGGRFLQLRAQLAPDAILYAVTAHYLPRNQPAVVASVTVAPKTKKVGKSSSGKSKQEKIVPGVYDVSWKVANPDGDTMRYRPAYRREGSEVWRPLLREHEVLTAAKHEWDTRGVADGFYRIRVEASDELDNPPGAHEQHAGESEPVRIDNHPPTVSGLSLKGSVLRGRAVDTLGPISELEYRLDAEDWRIFFPDDDLLDTADERFSLDLGKLASGPHSVAVRATDARDNTGTAELDFVVP